MTQPKIEQTDFEPAAAVLARVLGQPRRIDRQI